MVFGAVLPEDDDLLPEIWKNPSANLLLPETSLSPPASGRPAETVSVASEVEVVAIRTEKRSGTRM